MDSTSQYPQGSAPPPQPYQSGQQQYLPAGGYAPPPPAQKKGFNWLACCGITCLVLLILFVALFYGCYKTFQPIFNISMQLELLSNEVSNANASDIRANAVSVTPEQLASEASLYKDQWLRLEGEIIPDSMQGSASFSAGDFSTEETTKYYMACNVEVLDITNSSPAGGVGDTIVAYGQCYDWDLQELENIPLIGTIIVESIKGDPGFGGDTHVVYFVTKDIERVGVAGIDGSAGTVDTEVEPEDDNGPGWLR